ncbi:MAG: hypothetical protein H6838_15935 [Planctomycetes bacterium]|nr:hypothetical protein [Planctomycetota bacterium]
MMRIRNLLLLVTVLTASVGLGVWALQSQTPSRAAPQPEGAARGKLPQGHVYACIVEQPDDVNPFTASSPVAQRFVLGMTHDTLLDRDPATGELRASLAESYELDGDGGGCVFTLRDGVQFADGSPMTTADVLFGWDLAAAGHLTLGFAGGAFARIASVGVLGERRLHVRFKDRHFAALAMVGENWIVGQRQFFVDRVAAQARRLGQPVPDVATREFAVLLQQIKRECGPGSGPYELRNPPEGGGTWIEGQELVLRRNDRSWRRSARPGTWNLAGFRLLFRSAATIPAALAKHEIDWCMVRDPAAEFAKHPELEADYRAVSYAYPRIGVHRATWNCRRPPCEDARVRRALAMLFDRQGLADRFPQHAGVAEAFALRGSPEYPTTPGTKFDPAAARAELRAAGYDPVGGKPLHLELLVPQGSAELDAALAGFQDAARGVGIDLQVRQLDFPGFVAERARGNWDGEIAVQALAMNGDPYELVHTDGADNIGGYSNPEVDRLAEAARIESDPARRAAIWRELNTAVQRDQPVTFLLQPRVQMLFNRHIEGATAGPLGMVPETMWVPEASQRR